MGWRSMGYRSMGYRSMGSRNVGMGNARAAICISERCDLIDMSSKPLTVVFFIRYRERLFDLRRKQFHNSRLLSCPVGEGECPFAPVL